MAIDLLNLLNLGDTAAPAAFAASLFSFGKKQAPPSGPRQIDAIDRCVSEFLENRDIGKFRVFTTLHEQRPIVHVQAEAHKNLRFSNLIEIRIRQYVEEETGLEIGAVYWRFQMEHADEPAAEQASYEDYSPSPQAQEPSPASPVPSTQQAPPPDSHLDDYDIHRLAKEGIDVQEISQSELDALIGSQAFGKKDDKL
jgi:hypothetical protein